MTSDNPIFTALSEEIRAQLVSVGFNTNEIRIARGSQPTQQASGGATDAKKYQIFLTPITRSKIVMTKESRIDGVELKADYAHNKIMTWQIDCLTDFNHADADSIDANNFCETVNDLVGHFDAIYRLRNSGVSIVNCGAVRPSYTILNSDRYESTPSFDLQINYNSQYTKIVPSTSAVAGGIYEV